MNLMMVLTAGCCQITDLAHTGAVTDSCIHPMADAGGMQSAGCQYQKIIKFAFKAIFFINI